MSRKIVSGASGKVARVLIGGNEFCVEDWEIQEVGDEEDTTNSCGGGSTEQEVGHTSLEGSFNYTWAVADNPFAGPPDLSTGTKHALTRLYVHSTAGVGLQDGPFWAFTLHVTNHANSLPIRGKVSGVITWKSHGSYTKPSTDDSSGA